jgi:DNA-directed RNA polymerase specialized sigma24 family protein
MPAAKEVPHICTFREDSCPHAEVATHRAATPMEALMVAEPFAEPQTSLLETLGMRDTIADAVDMLEERARYIIEAIFWRGAALRELAAEMSLSKTHVARLRDEALEELGLLLAMRGGQVVSASDREDIPDHGGTSS